MSLGTKFIYGRKVTLEQIIELKNVATKLRTGYGGTHPNFESGVEMNMMAGRLAFDSQRRLLRHNKTHNNIAAFLRRCLRATRSYMEANSDLVMV